MWALEYLFDYSKDNVYRDEREYLLYDVTTKIDIGKFPAGTKFPRVEVDGLFFTITLCEEDLKPGKCRIPDDKQHKFRYKPEITEEVLDEN